MSATQTPSPRPTPSGVSSTSIVEGWPAPNFKDPVTRGNGIVIATAVLVAVAIPTVLARLWARFVILRNPGVDDYLFIASFIIALIFVAFSCLAVFLGSIDRHEWDVPRHELIMSFKTLFAVQMLYVPVAGLIKTSVLLFYRRLAAGTVTNTYKYIVWTALAFVAATTVAFWIMVFVTCLPTQAFWQQFNPTWTMQHSFTCVNPEVPLLVFSTISAAQDLLAVALPLSLVWRLRMPRNQKIALLIILGVGLFTFAAGVMRTYYIWEALRVTKDITWGFYDVLLMTNIEVLLSIICASAPTLKIYFRGFGSEGEGRSRRGGIRRKPLRHLLSPFAQSTDQDIVTDEPTTKSFTSTVPTPIETVEHAPPTFWYWDTGDTNEARRPCGEGLGRKTVFSLEDLSRSRSASTTATFEEKASIPASVELRFRTASLEAV